MKLYSLDGAQSVTDPAIEADKDLGIVARDAVIYELDADGAFELPDELALRLLAIRIGGSQIFEDEETRSQRLIDEEIARRQDPQTLLTEVEGLRADLAATARRDDRPLTAEELRNAESERLAIEGARAAQARAEIEEAERREADAADAEKRAKQDEKDRAKREQAEADERKRVAAEQQQKRDAEAAEQQRLADEAEEQKRLAAEAEQEKRDQAERDRLAAQTPNPVSTPAPAPADPAATPKVEQGNGGETIPAGSESIDPATGEQTDDADKTEPELQTDAGAAEKPAAKSKPAKPASE